jgi:hypothetical protein
MYIEYIVILINVQPMKIVEKNDIVSTFNTNKYFIVIIRFYSFLLKCVL